MTKTRCEPDNCLSACCNPVMLPYTQTQFAMQQQHQKGNRQWQWVMEDLTRIPAREGYAANPQLRGLDMVDQYGNSAAPVFYQCRHYDENTNRCTDYANRPDTCREFPWYEGQLPIMRDAMALHPACSFNADLGREVAVRIRG